MPSRALELAHDPSPDAAEVDHTDSPMADERRYSSEEVALVLSRVAELSVAEGDGLTQAELSQVVREAGLDPALVSRALVDLDANRRAEARSLGLRVLAFRRWRFRGFLDAGRIEHAAVLVNRSVGCVGEVHGGVGLSWFGRHVSVSVMPVPGAVEDADGSVELELVIQEKFRNTANGVVGLSATMSMPMIMMGMSLVLGGVLPAALLLGGPPLVYWWFSRRHNRRVDETEASFEALGAELQTLFAAPRSAKALGAAEA